MLSFRGDLVHGGEPISSGVRYIIAAFLFVELPSPSKSHLLLLESPVLDGDVWADTGCKRKRNELESDDLKNPMLGLKQAFDAAKNGQSDGSAVFAFNFVDNS